MPISQDAFSEYWQKAIREADIQKQMWFLAAVFGGKTPMVVNASSINIQYNSETDNYVISSKGKKVELPGNMMVALMEKVAPPLASTQPSASASADNIYSSATLKSTGSKPPSNPPPAIPNQYGKAPKKKVVQNPQGQYGTVPRPAEQDPNKAIMASVNDVQAPPAAVPSFPVTTATPANRKAALVQAANLYGSTSAVSRQPAQVSQNPVYGSIPPQPESDQSKSPNSPATSKKK